MELKDQIRIARESAGLSLDGLAAAMGVSRQACIWWEEGRSTPRLPKLKQLEQVLGTKLDATGLRSTELRPDAMERLEPQAVSLAIAIMRLPASLREAVSTLVTGLASPDGQMRRSISLQVAAVEREAASSAGVGRAAPGA